MVISFLYFQKLWTKELFANCDIYILYIHPIQTEQRSSRRKDTDSHMLLNVQKGALRTSYYYTAYGSIIPSTSIQLAWGRCYKISNQSLGRRSHGWWSITEMMLTSSVKVGVSVCWGKHLMWPFWNSCPHLPMGDCFQDVWPLGINDWRGWSSLWWCARAQRSPRARITWRRFLGDLFCIAVNICLQIVSQLQTNGQLYRKKNKPRWFYEKRHSLFSPAVCGWSRLGVRRIVFS